MRHTRNPGYRSGEHWAECPRCGMDYYASQLQEEWTGWFVCNDCWEPRHPQDFVRGIKDKITAERPVYMPDTSNVVTGVGTTYSAVVGIAIAGSAQVGRIPVAKKVGTFNEDTL